MNHDMPRIQLQMILPEAHFAALPVLPTPAGYRLRVYQPGDEPEFYRVMEAAGFGFWDDERLRAWIGRILPDGWFMLLDDASGQIVATAMCLHEHSDQHPFGGELGWVAADPAHQGKGLGMIVCTAATARLIRGGYRNIHLYTEDFRLAALKTYFRLGYVPLLYAPDMPDRWRTVCAQLGLPFTPEQWA